LWQDQHQVCFPAILLRFVIALLIATQGAAQRGMKEEYVLTFREILVAVRNEINYIIKDGIN